MDQYELYLCHHGVKGMKWGVRKARQLARSSGRLLRKTASYGSRMIANRHKGSNKTATTARNNDERQAKVAKAKKAVKVGAAVAGTVLAAYGAYKIHDLVRKTNTKARINQAMRSVDIILGNDITGTRYSTEQKSKMIRDGLEAGRSFAKNDSFGTALKNATRYEILRRTKRL